MRPQWANICLVHVCIEKTKAETQLCERPLTGGQASYSFHLITERAMQLKPREQDKGFWTSIRYFDTQSPFVDSYLTFQSVLLSPHDVNQRVLQRMHVKAIE